MSFRFVKFKCLIKSYQNFGGDSYCFYIQFLINVNNNFYCFQVVDMCWGVCDEFIDDYFILELCLKEFKVCQDFLIGFNFMVNIIIIYYVFICEVFSVFLEY